MNSYRYDGYWYGLGHGTLLGVLLIIVLADILRGCA